MMCRYIAPMIASSSRRCVRLPTGVSMSERALLYPYKVTIEVSFRDLDAMGHVNNAVYLSYMETARIKFLVDLLAVTSLHDLPVIMAEATCTFKSPAFFGEQLTVGVGISRFGSKSFDMTYRIDA